jgi:phosphate transport system permease protein
MNGVTPASVVAARARSARFHLWRSRKDRLVHWSIATGGVAVIGAVVLIFFYLIYVVFPLFLPAATEFHKTGIRQDWENSSPVYLSIEEQQEIGLRLSDTGAAEFFSVAGASAIESHKLPLGNADRITLASESIERNGLVAAATDNGNVLLFSHQYETTFEGGVETRKIIPSLQYPYGEEHFLSLGSSDISAMALSDGDKAMILAVAGRSGMIKVVIANRKENLLTGDFDLKRSSRELKVDFQVTAMAVSGNHQWLYLADGRGRVHRLSLETMEMVQSLQLGAAPITAMNMLLGGISILAGDAEGRIFQLFPVRDQDNQFRLELIREFSGQTAAVDEIIPEQRRKGFLATDAGNGLGIYHSTAGQMVHFESLQGPDPRAFALSPRANGLLIELSNGTLGFLGIKNEHPEISFSSLWKKVWYENYGQAEYVWQSSASSNDFEPKFSLTPLVFGTLKAAVYAMLFAIPLSLMGAAYTAYFMAPGLRKLVKPGIEIMAALPTVILGFLAGLWFAPWVEEHLAGIFMILLVLPPGLLLFGWYWNRHEGPLKSMVPEGYEPVLLLPVLLILCLMSMWLAEPVQFLFFGGDLRIWLSNEAGIAYDQRNALVVGIAMGFAVIPTIYSLAEDAVFGVPQSLCDGSLALGATPWQTLVRVVLPTASPGLFSALMIGMGRAVGETMIVLMATGNTPIMDWNLFEGMRTLAANIAVEMPESEVDSSHYRILFLAALVLFVFTFVVNTGAEIVRQGLRKKYSSI